MSVGIKKKMIIAMTVFTFLLSGCSKEAGKDDSADAATSASVENASSEEISVENLEPDSSAYLDSVTYKISLSEDASSENTADSAAAGTASSDSAVTGVSSGNSEASTGSSENKKTDVSSSAGASSSSISSDKASADASSTASDSSKSGKTADDGKDKAGDENAKEETAKAPEPAPAKQGYGRILFVGDSRTVDIFDAGSCGFYGRNEGGVTVYCEDGANFDFLCSSVDKVGLGNFDTLISWMGCNDKGSFSNYEIYYNLLLENGKTVIVCNVGPTADQYLASDYDRTYYINDFMIAYNNSLANWAAQRGVKVIDMYSYLNGNQNLYLDPVDGIHFQPQPTSEIWTHIFNNL